MRAPFCAFCIPWGPLGCDPGTHFGDTVLACVATVSHPSDRRIQELIGKARRKDVVAAWAVGVLCVSVGVLLFATAKDTAGVVFGCLFFLVGGMGGLAIHRLDGGKLRTLYRRLEQSPDQVAWLHVSSIANKLRRGEATVIVFFLDRTYVRLALPKVEAHELFDLVGARCPAARVTRELPLPELLEHEAQWRKDPEAFRKG